MDKEKFNKIFNNSPVFFLGANSSKGFKSFFHKSCDAEKGERMYVIKGGPGTGKSTLMKNVLENIYDKGQNAEIILCSTDMNSLDGVVFPDLGISIVDGTPPHTVEPKYPGAVERAIPLSEYFNNDFLTNNSKEIISLCETNSSLHKKASKLISGAGDLLNDNFAIDCACANLKDVVCAARCTAELFLENKQGEKGGEKIRFLSGVSGDGIVFFSNTVKFYAHKIIAIEDKIGAVSTVFMSVIRKYAIDNGYSIITCPCAIFPDIKIDHIIIPEKSLAFCTVNSFFDMGKEYTKIIHSNRFRDMDLLRNFKERISFNIKASKELVNSASSLIKDAKNVHDLIEQKYISAMNFDGVKHYSQRIISEICDLL